MEQGSIPLPPQKAPDPTGRDCEWCGDPSHHAVEMINSKGVGVQRYMYTCDAHKEIAELNRKIKGSGR